MIWVEFLKSRQGFGYVAGDKACIDKNLAEILINEGFVKKTDELLESNLPDSLPGREALIKEGLRTIEQVLASAEALTDIKGIGQKTALEIVNILKNKE